MELFRVLQRANLTTYYDAFISQGGDDVPQLADTTEEEFLDIMRVVGMANKPLHIRRLQKALAEWKMNPEKFQAGVVMDVRPPILPFTPQHQSTPQASSSLLSQSLPQSSSTSSVRPYVPSSSVSFSLSNIDNPISTSFRTPQKLATPLLSKSVSGLNLLPLLTNTIKDMNETPEKTTKPPTFRGIPVSLLPNATLTPEQRLQIDLAAEEMIKCIPDYPIKEPIVKTKKNRQLMEVINMPPNYPHRLTAIYKYSAIYGRFDRPRKTGKAMNHHEVSVNEAAAQLALRMPSLLSRREDLYPLARQVVRIAEDACRDIIRTKQQKKKAKKSLMNSIASQISAFYANDPEAGILSLQEKIEKVKGELSEMVSEQESLRQAFIMAKNNGPSGLSVMTEIQKQIDNLSAVQQIRMAEQARLIQEVRRFRAAMQLGQSISEHDSHDDNRPASFSNDNEAPNTHHDNFMFQQRQQSIIPSPPDSSIDNKHISGHLSGLPALSVFPSLTRMKTDPHLLDVNEDHHMRQVPTSCGSLSPATTGLLMSIFPGAPMNNNNNKMNSEQQSQQHSTNMNVDNNYLRFSSCLPVFPNFTAVKSMPQEQNVIPNKCESTDDPRDLC